MLAVLFMQSAPASARLAVTVAVTVPALVQVSVGDGELALARDAAAVPPVMAHERNTSVPVPALLMPCAERLIAPPTSTEEGLAESAVTAAQGFTTETWPLILTDPKAPASTLVSVQTRSSDTLTVDLAVTLNAALPTHPTPVEVVAVTCIE